MTTACPIPALNKTTSWRRKRRILTPIVAHSKGTSIVLVSGVRDEYAYIAKPYGEKSRGLEKEVDEVMVPPKSYIVEPTEEEEGSHS